MNESIIHVTWKTHQKNIRKAFLATGRLGRVLLVLVCKVTPLKTKMEPKNHPIEQEIHLPNLHFWVPAVNLPGCICSYL